MLAQLDIIADAHSYSENSFHFAEKFTNSIELTVKSGRQSWIGLEYVDFRLRLLGLTLTYLCGLTYYLCGLWQVI